MNRCYRSIDLIPWWFLGGSESTDFSSLARLHGLHPGVLGCRLVRDAVVVWGIYFWDTGVRIFCLNTSWSNKFQLRLSQSWFLREIFRDTNDTLFFGCVLIRSSFHILCNLAKISWFPQEGRRAIDTSLMFGWVRGLNSSHRDRRGGLINQSQINGREVPESIGPLSVSVGRSLLAFKVRA